MGADIWDWFKTILIDEVEDKELNDLKVRAKLLNETVTSNKVTIEELSNLTRKQTIELVELRLNIKLLRDCIDYNRRSMLQLSSEKTSSFLFGAGLGILLAGAVFLIIGV